MSMRAQESNLLHLWQWYDIIACARWADRPGFFIYFSLLNLLFS